MLTAEHLDVPLDYEGVAAAGSMLGTKALQIFDQTTSVVRAVLRWTEFYKHESCGKCTPCREGTWWMVQILQRLDGGKGRDGDIELLVDLCENILGRSFCALGDGATSPITSAIKYFGSEFKAGMHTPSATLFPPERSVAWAAARGRNSQSTSPSASPAAFPRGPQQTTSMSSAWRASI
jgi:NADH-quinone oxidoreductase subunit F